MRMMDSYGVALILGFVTALLIKNSGGIYHQRTIRALDFPAQWRPLAVPAPNEHLISIANFDAANKAQLAQIAHHNAQILRQIKGLHPPVTQYHNPYPIFASGHGNGKNVFVHTNIIHPSLPDTSTNNLLTSSSNVAQTVVPHNVKHNYVSPKPSFMGKVEMNSPFKFLNSIHTSTAKIPGLIKAVQPNYPIYASTTSRVPIIRDVTLTPPPSYRSTPKSHPVNKLNAHLALSTRTKAPVMAASNTFDAFSIPGQILSSFANFAQPSHVIRENKPRVSNNFLNYQIEQPYSNSYTGHLIPSGHYISKNHYPGAMRYPQNSISSVYSPHSQHTVHLKHPSQQLQQQQIVQNQPSNVQQPEYVKPNEQQHLTESFHSQSISHGNSNQQTENQFQKPSAESTDNTQNDGSYLPPLPSIPPSVLSPFFQQVQQQQQQQQQQHEQQQHHHEQQQQHHHEQQQYHHEQQQHHHEQQQHHHEQQQHHHYRSTTTTVEPPYQENDPNKYANAFDLYKTNKDVQFSNFKAIENEFTHNLVPPPFKYKDASQLREKPPASSSSSYLDVEQIKAIDILNKYNIPAISPLQDANRYAYKNRPVQSTETSVDPRPTENHQFGTSPSFTTEKPNIFQNLNRPAESEYKQHKLMHPSYTGAKRPIHSTNQPFLPTPHSHDVAITHSFFTIEDAVTLSPKHSYRPILPTNIDQIEDIIRKPAEEEITEVITLSPVNNDLQENVKETSPLPVFETSTRLRGRGNKIRRRKPKPSTEANDDTQGQWETVKVDNMQNDKELQHSNYNEAVAEENPKDEVVENFGNFNRNRYRGRVSSTASTIENSISEKPTRGRRPLNKSRYRTSSLPTSASDASDTIEHTTTDSNANPFLSNRHRRPTTTLQTVQTFSSPSAPQSDYKDVEATDPATVISDIQSSQPMRTRVYATPITNYNLNQDSTETFPAKPIVGHPEENLVVISTKAAFSDLPITNVPESETTVNNRQNTFPVDETVIPTTPQHSSTSTTSTTSTTTRVSEDPSEKTGLDHIRNRQRLRYKDKLKDTFSSSTSTSSETPIEKTVEYNEVTDNRVNVRLPVVTSSSKISDDEEAVTTPTFSTNKLNRLNSMNKFESRNRPRFSVKDYRQRLSTSTTTEQTSSDTESTTLATTRLRFPTRTRLLPDLKKSVEKVSKSQDSVKSSDDPSDALTKPDLSQETTETASETTRKRFSPKDRYSSRVKSTENSIITTTNRPTTRSRGSTRRDFGNRGRQSTTTPLSAEKTVTRSPVIRNSNYTLRRPQNVSLRQRIQNHYKTTKEPTSSNEVDSQADMTMENKSDEISTEDYKHETAIMKIAKDDHSYRPYKASDEINYNDSDNDLNGSPSEQSERVAELAIFDNHFNSVHTGSASRRIPGYFTIATEDPILPIEAFFPQVKRD